MPYAPGRRPSRAKVPGRKRGRPPKAREAKVVNDHAAAEGVSVEQAVEETGAAISADAARNHAARGTAPSLPPVVAPAPLPGPPVVDRWTEARALLAAHYPAALVSIEDALLLPEAARARWAPAVEPVPEPPAGLTDTEHDRWLIDHEIRLVRRALHGEHAKVAAGKPSARIAGLEDRLVKMIRERAALRPPALADPGEEERRWQRDAASVVAKIEAGVVSRLH